MKITAILALLVLACSAIVHAQTQLDLTDPAVRKMLLKERKGLVCKGIYQQTRLKVEARLKLLNKLEASGGVNPEKLASLTEVTTALGQKRREFCELYKVTPEFTKDDYFRAWGEFDKSDSDVELLFRYATGQASENDLKGLRTVTPRHESGGSVDVNATLKEILQGVDSIVERVAKTEEKVRNLQEKHVAQQEAEKEAEARRRTLPQMAVNLELQRGKFSVRIVSLNLIPFECTWAVVTTNDRLVSGIMLGWQAVYSTERKKVFRFSENVQLQEVTDDYLELRFRYRSVFSAEQNYPESLQGEIIRKYRLANGILLEEKQH